MYTTNISHTPAHLCTLHTLSVNMAEVTLVEDADMVHCIHGESSLLVGDAGYEDRETNHLIERLVRAPAITAPNLMAVANAYSLVFSSFLGGM